MRSWYRAAQNKAASFKLKGGGESDSSDTEEVDVVETVEDYRASYYEVHP